MNKKNKSPFFFFFSVVKNDQDNIEKLIKSVLSQTFKSYEYILIDGNSNDQTLQKIQKFKKRIKLILSEKDNGLYFAMNKGLKLSKGKVVVFVNSGDKLSINALKIINQKFNRDSAIDFIFGTVRRYYTTTSILKYGYSAKRLKYNFDFATSHSTGFFIKLKTIKKIGYFNTDYKCSADYDLYYKAIIVNKLKGGFTSKKQLIGTVQSGGYSSRVTFFDHLFEETKIRIMNNQNILFIILIFCNALIKNFVKKII